MWWILGVVIVVAAVFTYFYIRGSHIEIPAYQVVSQHGNIEQRRYAPMIIAEVTVRGDRREAANQGFRILANYIFGNHTAVNADESIDMTAPVMQEKQSKIDMTAPVMTENDASGEWTIRFVMPKHFTMATLPKPNNKLIKIVSVPEKSYWVIRFSGTSGEGNLNRHLKTLQNFMKEHGYKSAGPYQYAFYNPPWTLPFMRRNEVMVPVAD